jgi:hypothetical protein
MPARIALILLCLCLCSGISRAQQGTTGTAFDNAIELPIYGRMIGAIWNGTLDLFSENYGQQIYPLGDIDHDGLNDWILKHERTDSVRSNPVSDDRWS